MRMFIAFFVLSVGLATQAPVANEAQETLLSEVRQLTFDGKRSGEGYYSADGRSLVFQSERDAENPFYQIFLMDLESGETRKVSPGVGKTTCAWVHPSGQEVLFSSTHLDPEALDKQREELERRERGERRRYQWDYDETYDIFVRDLESGELRQVTTAVGYDAEASFSPDGSQILFSSNRQAYERELTEEEREQLERDPSYFQDLYVMDADGSNLRRLTTYDGADGGAFFSADGSKIVWRRFAGRAAEVWTMDADGSNKKQITNLGVVSWAPYYHPSGDYILFATNLHGHRNFEVYMVDAEGESEPVRVTFANGFDGLPVFSPDGQQVSFVSTRGSGGSQLFVSQWDDAQARRLLGLEQPLPEVEVPEAKATLIHEPTYRAHVEYLASAGLEGRMTGTPGEALAVHYIKDQFQRLGLVAAGEVRGEQALYTHSFEFTAGASLGERNILRSGSVDFGLDRDFRPLALSLNGRFEAKDMVFAGYGIVAPTGEGQAAYDSYGDVDVKDKWVMVLRHQPEKVSIQRKQYLVRYSSLRTKAMEARRRGAKGIMVVSDKLVPLRFDASLSGSGIVALSLSSKIAGVWVPNLAALKEDLDLETKVEPFGFEVPLWGEVDIVHVKKTGFNVLGRLKTGAPGQVRPAIVIGAHLDHLGRGEASGSRAGDDEEGQVHFGADDNASGVAGMLEVARVLSVLHARGELETHYDFVFAGWSGEELGLLGSKSYTGQDPHRASLQPDVAAYLNMDMIGRLRDKVYLQGVDSSPRWTKIIEKVNAGRGMPVATSGDPYLPTDAMSFYLKKVPVLSAFTGVHDEYHTPRDTTERLNFGGAVRIADLVAHLTMELARSEAQPQYREVPRSGGGGGGGFRVYLGTIPDYAANDVKGVLLSGVKAGSPAEAAGLQGGDLIISLADTELTNIYDYVAVLQVLNPGETVPVVVMRGEERLELRITPAAKD